MAAVPPSRSVASVHAAVVRACAREHAPLELLGEVAQTLRRAVPYAVAGWLLTDPVTQLPTGVISESVEPHLTRRLMEHELTHDDLNRFTALVRRRQPVARLSATTDGHLERSFRHRRLYQPYGYGDELRAVLRTGDACWGQVCLTRRAGEPHFSDADVAVFTGLTAHISTGLRTSLVLQQRDVPAPSPQTPGVLILDGDDDVESRDAAVERWLRKLPSGPLPLPAVIYAVARQARLLASGTAAAPPTARARTRSGGYVAVRGTCLASQNDLASQHGDAFRVAVVLEPPRPTELAPLITALADLTAREQEITKHLVGGTPTGQIAQSLWISQHTLRGHIKAIFTKLRVHSRAELAALFLQEHIESFAQTLECPPRS